MHTLRLVVAALLTCLSACTERDPPSIASRGPEPTAPAVVAATPLAGMTPSDQPIWRGVVVDRLAAGSYTYLRIDVDAHERWVAVVGSGHGVGDRVVVESMGVHRDFHSRRLGRAFDELHFASVRDDDG